MARPVLRCAEAGGSGADDLSPRVMRGYHAVMGGRSEREPRVLTRGEASDRTAGLGWRYVQGSLLTFVPTGSLAEAVRAADHAATAVGPDADDHLSIEILPDRACLRLQTMSASAVTAQDVAWAGRITQVLRSMGLDTIPDSAARSVQVVEVAIDAMDIAAVRPFWKAVMDYTDEGIRIGPTDALVDPLGHGPAVRFQQMDAPHPHRNRIHCEVSVPHDVAGERVRRALEAGGRLVNDRHAPRFWGLADAEGNEVRVTTWQGDPVA